MKQTAFHDFYNARVLETLPLGEKLLPVYASSNIKIYPFQIAAADFALRSRYQKGTVLCDEAGLGKSHEAMLVIAQKWLEGARHILLAVPNADLLCQWTALLEQFYSVPYAVLSSCAQWDALVTVDEPNPFLQDAVVITTYEFAAANEEAAKAVPWDLVVFEEANALSAVYQEGNRQAKALKRIAGGAFKLLLTGTPIEKNIMDLYGLIWFIDETVLPDDREFLARYLRRPERYPELAELVRPYCFRTLRAQAQSYAKVTRRVLLTYEYAPSPQEQALYNLLYAYVNQTVKLAFQEMDRYDLALRLLGLQSSSTAAVLQTIRGVIKRLERMPDAAGELAQWREMETAALEVKQDTKAVELLSALKLGFSAIKKWGGARKAVIFTESVETQNMLFPLLEGRYKTSLYRGGADYSAIRAFKEEGEVLISTDNGARGFNLEVLKLLQSAYFRKVKMIYIDPPYNTGNDFVYADDFADPLARYKEVTAQTTKSNPETMGRFHTNWLNMMYPRLRLAANLLRDDGVIFISIDDNEVDNLKKICNEVFGEENFVAQIVWQKRTSPDARRIISPGHEYILIYGKICKPADRLLDFFRFLIRTRPHTRIQTMTQEGLGFLQTVRHKRAMGQRISSIKW